MSCWSIVAVLVLSENHSIDTLPRCFSGALMFPSEDWGDVQRYTRNTFHSENKSGKGALALQGRKGWKQGALREQLNSSRYFHTLGWGMLFLLCVSSHILYGRALNRESHCVRHLSISSHLHHDKLLCASQDSNERRTTMHPCQIFNTFFASKISQQ